jgi:hypothetical protein
MAVVGVEYLAFEAGLALALERRIGTEWSEERLPRLWVASFAGVSVGWEIHLLWMNNCGSVSWIQWRGKRKMSGICRKPELG